MTATGATGYSSEQELRRRLEDGLTRARELTGRPARPGAEPAVAQSAAAAEAIGWLEQALAQRDPAGAWRAGGEAHAARLEHLRHRYQARSEALEAAERATAELRDITSPATILARAPAQLCQHSRLDRAVLSLLKDGLLVAEAVHFATSPVAARQALEALRAQPPRLAHPLIETELLRRRRATIVTDAQASPRVHQATARILQWDSYVAAPLVVRGELLGAIHADAARSGRALDVLDGDVLWSFARRLADVYESAALRRSLLRQREQMRAFVEWLEARSLEISDTSMALVPEWPPPPEPPGQPAAVAVGGDLDDSRVFADLLTRRELDVLRLLARGESNRQIAAHLVISEATVKFHVVNLLRKLRVDSRAAAVARYHRLVRRASAEE